MRLAARGRRRCARPSRRSRYLRAELARVLPRPAAHAAARGHVGPAAAARARTTTSASASREHRVVEDGAAVTIAGGKYTTFRVMARDALARRRARLGRARAAAARPGRRRCRAPLAPTASSSSGSPSSRSSTSSRARVEDVVRRRTHAVARVPIAAAWPPRDVAAAHGARGSAGAPERTPRGARQRYDDALRRRASRCSQRAPGGRHERRVRAGDRPGHHRHHRAAARRARRGARRAATPSCRSTSRARLGRARRRRDLARACCAAVARGAARAPAPTARAIAAIGITNQRETTLLWDRATRRAGGARDRVAGPPHRRRAAPRCSAPGLEREVRRRTGLVLDPYFSATKLEWLLRARARRCAPRARRGAIAFGTVDSWLLWKLTGGARARHRPHQRLAHAALRHRAAGAGTTRCSSRFGVPRVGAAARCCPRAATFGAHARRAPSCPTASRSPASPATSRRRCSARAASRAGQSQEHLRHRLLPAAPHRHAARRRRAPGCSPRWRAAPRGEPAYALEGSVFIAGAAIQWLRDGLGLLAARARQRGARARRSRTRGGVVLVPAFVGPRRALLAARRARRAVRPHPRHDARAHRARDARVDGVPDPRPGRGDGARRAARRAARAARRRRRRRQRLADAVSRPTCSACRSSARA